MGAAGMAMVGFVDDRRRLRPLTKLLLQCALAGVVVGSGAVFRASGWHWVNVAFSFLWIVSLTNSFNLIANMDGLSAGVAGVSTAVRGRGVTAGRFWPHAAHAAMRGGAFWRGPCCAPR